MEIWLHYYETPNFPIDINFRHDDVVIAPIIYHSQRSLDERSDVWIKSLMPTDLQSYITDDEVKITGTAITHLAYNYSRKCGALMQYYKSCHL